MLPTRDAAMNTTEMVPALIQLTSTVGRQGGWGREKRNKNIEQVLKNKSCSKNEAGCHENGKPLFILVQYSLSKEVIFKLDLQEKKDQGMHWSGRGKNTLYIAYERRCVSNLKKACPYTLLQGFLAPWVNYPPSWTFPACTLFPSWIHHLTLTEIWLLGSYNLISQILNSPKATNFQRNNVSTHYDSSLMKILEVDIILGNCVT